jgi:thiosulfate reductase cytochrome b subunit
MNAERRQIYCIHERIWHWLQAAGIGALLLSGAAIHWPALSLGLPFAWMIVVHDTLGILLSVHAFLGLFYYATTGAIRQFFPDPDHFFSRAAQVADYYLRGIFRADPHPELRDPARRLNPLQQATYLAILNVLLPLQIGTGLLMFGGQAWVGAMDWLGGLPVLAAVHTLGAWLFAAFLVMHVYLTTTGPTPLSYLKGMVFGYSDEVPMSRGKESESPRTVDYGSHSQCAPAGASEV